MQRCSPVIFALLLAGLPVHAGDQIPPADSEMAKSNLSVSPFANLDNPLAVKAGGGHLESKESSAFEAGELPPGAQSGIKFTYVAEPLGCKGDCTVAKTMDPDFKMLGGWFYISPDTRVQQIGIQLQEAGGEYFLLPFPGDFTGWKWLEGKREQLVQMDQKTGQYDGVLSEPITRVSIFWFQKGGAPGVVGVAGLTQAVQ